MQAKRCNFEVDGMTMRLIDENSKSQFATLEVDVCRSGENTHDMPIPREAIEASALSVKGKPLLAAFQFADVDFGGHDFDETPIGFFVENEEPELVEQEYKGKPELFLRQKAKIWKRYFSNAMDIFERKGGKTDVSMEIEILDGEEPENGNQGNINLFSIMGCTLLGVNPAIRGSEARVLSFSDMKDEYKKESTNVSELEKFSTERKEKMAEVSYKINKTELKETPWGDVDKTAMRDKIMKAINKATLVKSVYALVENGWQDAPSQHLKYPIMQLVGDTFYYNRYALASALAYAKQENETSVINKVEKLYRKFNLDEDEGGDDKNMAKDTKNMAAEQEENIIMEEEKMEDDVVMQEEEMCDGKMEEEVFESEDDKEVGKADENDEPNDDDAKGSDEDAEDFEQKACTDNEDVMSDGEEDMSEDEVDMALDVNNYAGAMLEMLKAENDEQREEAKKLGMSEDEKLNSILDAVFAFAKEFSDLKQFKADTLAEKTTFEVARILGSVKQDLPQEKYAELEAQSKDCTYDNLGQFELQAKAFAYENGIKRNDKKDTHIRMGFDMNVNAPEKHNVFAEILSK